MKYTISINQKAFLENFPEMEADIVDLAILDFVVDWYGSSYGQRFLDNGQEFLWVDHKNLVNELPLLRLKKEAVKDRLSKLVEKGFLEKRIFNRCMPCYRPTKQADLMRFSTKHGEEEGGSVEQEGRGVEQGGGGGSNTQAPPPSTPPYPLINPLINISSKKAGKPAKEKKSFSPEFLKAEEDFCETFISKCTEVFGFKPAFSWARERKAFRDAVESLGIDPSEPVRFLDAYLRSDDNFARQNAFALWVFWRNYNAWKLVTAGKSIGPRSASQKREDTNISGAEFMARAARGELSQEEMDRLIMTESQPRQIGGGR